MGFLEQFQLQPTPHIVHLLDFLIIMMLVFHIPFSGSLFGSTLIGIFNLQTRKKFAERVSRLVTANAYAWFVFGILPLMALAVLFVQYFHIVEPRQGIVPFPFMIHFFRILIFTVGAYVLTFAWQRTMDIKLGGLAVLFQIVAMFDFVSVLSISFYPEKWASVGTTFPGIFSIHVPGLFLFYLAMAFFMTGAALLFFLFRWEDTRLEEDSPDRDFALKLSHGIVLSTGLIMPLMLVMEMFIASEPLNFFDISALSFSVFRTVVVMLIVLMIAVLFSFFALKNNKAGSPSIILVLAVLFIGLFSFKTHLLQANANLEQQSALRHTVDAQLLAMEQEREKLYTRNVVADLKVGEQVFKNKCSACHAFETQILGPAYNAVLPKYVDSPDDMEAYVRNPVKINPELPIMPAQGLTEEELISVCAYILTVYQEQHK